MQVVDTTHINRPCFDRDGTPQSEQRVEINERFTLSADQQRLDYVNERPRQ